MTILTTERLRLEPFDQAHLDGLNAMHSDPEVMRFLGGPESRERTMEIIRRVKSRWAEYGYSWWSLIERATEEVIGAGAIQNLRKGGDAPDPACPLEIGWRLRRDRWHRGFAIEAAVVMSDFAFRKLNAEVLLAVCDPDNAASAAVMKRLGMRYRGVEDWYGKALATYAVTAGEWADRDGEQALTR